MANRIEKRRIEKRRLTVLWHKVGGNAKLSPKSHRACSISANADDAKPIVWSQHSGSILPIVGAMRSSDPIFRPRRIGCVCDRLWLQVDDRWRWSTIWCPSTICRSLCDIQSICRSFCGNSATAARRTGRVLGPMRRSIQIFHAGAAGGTQSCMRTYNFGGPNRNTYDCRKLGGLCRFHTQNNTLGRVWLV